VSRAPRVVRGRLTSVHRPPDSTAIPLPLLPASRRIVTLLPRLLVAAASVALALSALPGQAVAMPVARQVAPPASPATTPANADPWLEVVSIAVEYTRITGTLQLVSSQVDALTPLLADADHAFQDADHWLTVVQDQLSGAIDRLQTRAAASYRQHGGSIGTVLDVDRTQQLASAAQYVEDASSVDATEVNRLTGVVQQASADRDVKAQAFRDLELQLQQLIQTRDALTARAQSDQAALDALGGVPVMGTPRVDAAHLAAWFTSTGRAPILVGGTPIQELAQLFIEEGAAEGVRGDLAFAQSIIETGYFREIRGNNFAGIGNCDSCDQRGYAFPSPRDGVRAQIQLLRNYADPTSRATNLAFPPEPGLYGSDPVVAAAKFDTFFLKGHVPLWNQMGHGNWATDPTYAGKVLGVYTRILEFAAAHS
jgi:hypothetical protein